MSVIAPFTFNFNNKNSKKDFGIIGTSYDVIFPKKRERKQIIPMRDGAYDFGAEWYDERIVRVTCKWFNPIANDLTRSDIRGIAAWLSKKGKLELAVEPDKYYIGELYDPAELIAHYDYSRGIGTTDGSFELNFICEPHAYGTTKLIQLFSDTAISYAGSATTPTVLTIKNTGTTNINSIQITVRRRKI